MDRAVVSLLLAALAAVTLAAVPAPGRSGVPCTGSPHQARPITIQVDGEDATGLFAVPKTAPRGLVVFAHGYGHTAESWREHLTRTAEQDGVIAVAMDYRGTEILPPDERGALPSSRGWQVAEGAEDSIAVAQLFERRCPTIDQLVVYGVSMGGNTSGLAAAAGASRSDGGPLFDHWVAVEGASNVVETYQAARLLAGTGNEFAVHAVEDIERQMGGTFEEVPDTYLERTVVTRADDIAASGIRGVILVHGVDDGLVPINQSREMAAALQAAGLPVEMHTVLTREPGTESGTTATGTVLGATGYESPFAGHASEASTTHTVGMAGFSLLSELFAGARVGCGEFLIDGTTGIRQGSSVPC